MPRPPYLFLLRYGTTARLPLDPTLRERSLDDRGIEFRGREVAPRGDDRMTYVGAGAVAPEGRQPAEVGVRGVELERVDRGAVAGEPARDLLDQRLGERTGIGGTAACAPRLADARSGGKAEGDSELAQ